MFRKYPEPEILKISISKGSSNNISYAVIESFNKTVGHASIEIVEDVVPVFLQRFSSPFLQIGSLMATRAKAD